MNKNDLNGSIFIDRGDDSETMTTRLSTFKKSQINEAAAFYNRLEQDSVRSPHHNIVLVRADDVEQLKLAYPNYWADTVDFTDLLKKTLKNQGFGVR